MSTHNIWLWRTVENYPIIITQFSSLTIPLIIIKIIILLLLFSECRDLMDLYIVIDGSDSISYKDFETLKKAIASLIPQIRLGERQARIGMLVYSSHVPTDSEHPFSPDKNYCQQSALTLSHPRDGTNTALGIKHMRHMFKKYGRPNVPWVALVITDGISKDQEATALEARMAKEMGISMFAVGITQKINLAELTAIADTDKQVIQLELFSELQRKLSSMMKTICRKYLLMLCVLYDHSLH